MNHHKILVALDGSERAFKTIEYLCSFKPFFKKELVLQTIITQVPEYYYDLEKEPSGHGENSPIKAWAMGHRAGMEAFMEKAKTRLIAAGYKSEAIQVNIKGRDKGIARDILEEARKGYGALLIRRRGDDKSLLPLALGSISTKLIEKALSLPILVAGVQQVNHSILIAIDGSEGSIRAVEFVAGLVKNSDCRIVLCSVLRDFEVYDETKKEKLTICVRAAFEKIELVIKPAVKILENAGIPRENIGTKLVQGVKSRAMALVETARQEHCDTLVFGRKGKSNALDFDIGRIPWKVIHGAREMTVWITP